ncbi:MAG TPA: glycosyltransferase family 2 protein [Patescibacteria group bacterium]|jgi:GT2 family glycosyltransferase|nr:glycosyltransferase family 2 protein [Patescibacteria group bacterium]
MAVKRAIKKALKLTPIRRLYDRLETLEQEIQQLNQKSESELLSYHKEYDRLRDNAAAQEFRNNEWAWEVRGLRLTIQRLQEYNAWFLQNYPNESQLQAQRRKAGHFAKRPLISIVMPTYNTDKKHLIACLDSVLNQTYDNWQLCIADDASNLVHVKQIIEEYAKKDKRIQYTFRSKNGHICKASNSAARLAKGEFIALLDHDDFLWPNALYEVVKTINQHPDTDFIYTDEDKVEEDGIVHRNPVFKPDFSFYFLRSTNYICHFSVFKRSLFEKVGGFRSGYEGSQDWDLFLRLSHITDKIQHIPTILYSWRLSPSSTAMDSNAKTYALQAQKRALTDDLEARNLKGTVKTSPYNKGIWLTVPALEDKPLISIVIPTHEMREYVERCVSSILQKTTYKNYEIILVENGSKKRSTFDYYRSLKNEGRVKVIKWGDKVKKFNYSEVCNFGAEHAEGKYLVMLNNDTEVIEPSWLENMLSFAQLPDVGAVGAQLIFPDSNTYQHVGIVVGIGSELPVANHPFTHSDVANNDDFKELFVQSIRECAGVTAACLMVAKDKFEKVKGFDPLLRVTFNDVDLSLKLLAQGWHNLYLPQVRLYHHESVSVGKVNVNRDMKELNAAAETMVRRWSDVIKHDPYYNPNFSMLSNNYGLDIHNDNKRVLKNIDEFLE